MALEKQLEEAAARLEEATWRIDQARKKSLSLESLQEWVNSLTISRWLNPRFIRFITNRFMRSFMSWRAKSI